MRILEPCLSLLAIGAVACIVHRPKRATPCRAAFTPLHETDTLPKETR